MSFQGVPTRLALIVTCKGCQRPIPAGITFIPDNALAIRCPICGEHRQYRPIEIGEGRTRFPVIQGGKR